MTTRLPISSDELAGISLLDHRLDLVLDIEKNQDKQRQIQEMRDRADLAYLTSLTKLRREERALCAELEDLDEALEMERRARMAS